jgi:hypothetical protein
MIMFVIGYVVGMVSLLSVLAMLSAIKEDDHE